MALDLKTLGVRSVSALVYVIILLSAVYFNYFTLSIFFFLIALLALNEFYNLVEKTGVIVFRYTGFISAILIFTSIFSQSVPLFQNSNIHFVVSQSIYLVPFILAIEFLFLVSENAFKSYAFSLLGVIYCVVPFALLIKIPINTNAVDLSEALNSYDYFKIMGIVFLIWANDTFAYLGGSLFGKHKMYARASPGKTWEGTLIGLVCCALVGVLLNYNNTFQNNWLWPVIGIFVGIFGTIGDLIESLIKRSVGVKDSGKIMPGHGGVLDRFDSLLFVSPFVYVIIKLFDNVLC